MSADDRGIQNASSLCIS